MHDKGTYYVTKTKQFSSLNVLVAYYQRNPLQQVDLGLGTICLLVESPSLHFCSSLVCCLQRVSADATRGRTIDNPAPKRDCGAPRSGSFSYRRCWGLELRVCQLRIWWICR